MNNSNKTIYDSVPNSKEQYFTFPSRPVTEIKEIRLGLAYKVTGCKTVKMNSAESFHSCLAMFCIPATVWANPIDENKASPCKGPVSI